MTDLNDFGYTDDVDDVLAVYVNNLLASTMRSEYKNVETLAADKTLADSDTPIQRLDCNGAVRIVKMPTEDAVDNHPFFIVNSSAGAYAITVKNNAGTETLATISQGRATLVLPSGAGGYLKADIGAIPNDGWIAISATATSGTLDAPSFEISFNADMTGIIGVGYRIKLTQSTTKYFIVTKVGSFSAGATIITCYGGTDYTLVASGTTAITNIYFSPMKAPFGFPLAENKWTVSVTDSTTRSQASPTSGTWYNLGSVSISAPIGLWRHVTNILPTVERASDGNLDVYVTLSTANNSESSASSTKKLAIRTGVYAEASTLIETTLELTSKTTHYINTKCEAASISNIYNNNGAQALTIKLICLYL